MNEPVQQMTAEGRQPITVDSESRAMLSAADMREHTNRIQQVMKAVMKENTHYGIIPGTKKPTLYKAGSETLLTTFKIGVDPEVFDLSRDDEVRYRVRCRGFHIPTGADLGYGIGECSSNEDKYRWRRAICESEYEDTPENRRRVRYSKYRGKVEKTKQIRVEPADVANTVLKMAKKRAQIDLTLTATGASDIFTQDIEDVPAELRDTMVDDHAPPKGPTLTEDQVADLESKLSEVSADRDKFMSWLKVSNLSEIPQSALPMIYKRIEQKAHQGGES